MGEDKPDRDGTWMVASFIAMLVAVPAARHWPITVAVVCIVVGVLVLLGIVKAMTGHDGPRR